jgi:hypothetical protein
VHHSEVIPAVVHVGEAAEQVACSCLGLVKLSSTNQVHYGVALVASQRVARRLDFDKLLARDRFLLGKASFLVLVAAAARAGIIASGLGHCGQHLRAEEDASFVPRRVDRRHIPPAATCL